MLNKVMVLDCTLRDGGYCNKWRFTEKGIRKIILGLAASKVEVVECGFLTNKVIYDLNISKYTELSQVEDFIPQHGNSLKFVLMLNYGEYDVDLLPERKNTAIDGLRVAFHKEERYEALKVCEKIKDKGYLVFVQPMVTMHYSDEEFMEMISLANEIEPYAFYIVDSFGTMKRNSLMHYFDIVEKKLDKKICIGFHSHNNMQLAFSNAESLINLESKHVKIIDSSIYGMGRGAGNLNSEIFMNELNEKLDKGYAIKPILQIMDEVINRFYEESPWGYSLPNYLSAVHMIHPNYAAYLSDKKTLAVDDIDEIFTMIDSKKGVEYDEKYINNLYIQYMSTGVIRNSHLTEIREKTKGRVVLLIAPGRNAIWEKDKICTFIEENTPVVISINHEYPVFDSDYVFVSNIRRFRDLDSQLFEKVISTSNIKSKETYVSVDYFKLLNTVDAVRDNAGLMAIKFVIEELSAKKVYLAGLDGYSHDIYVNFETQDMVVISSDEYMERTNAGMKTVLEEYKKVIEIEFITSSLLA